MRRRFHAKAQSLVYSLRFIAPLRGNKRLNRTQDVQVCDATKAEQEFKCWKHKK